MIALIGVMLGFVIVVGVLTTGDGLLSPAFFFLVGVFMVVNSAALLHLKSIAPTKAAATRRVRHTISTGDVPNVEVRLRRHTDMYGLVTFVVLLALTVAAAASAFHAGHPLLGALVSVLALPIVPVIIETMTTWKCRRALVLTPEALTIEHSRDRITLDWDDLEGVEVDTRHVRIQGIIPFRYGYVVARPKVDAASLEVEPRRRVRILPRRYRRSGILISTWLLDHPERVRQLLDAMRCPSGRGRPGQRRLEILSSATDYLTADARFPATSTSGD